MRNTSVVLAAWLGILCAQLADADPSVEGVLPPDLKPWVGWVLYDLKSIACPFEHNSSEQNACYFPSRLELNLSKDGGRFTLNGFSYRQGNVRLPGDTDHWPQEVMVDGRKAPVLLTDDGPAVELKAGSFSIEGAFKWSKLPNALAVPESTGIVGLSIEGRKIANPQVAEGGRLFLQSNRSEQEKPESNSVDVRVYRRVQDGVPVEITTWFEINASGQPREELLENWQLEGFVPSHIDAPLAVSIDDKGALRVQVRPGKWNIKVTSRSTSDLQEVSRPQPKPPLPASEIWVFEPNEALRLVAIEGVTAIDPSQTLLPQEWRGFATYQVQSDDSFLIKVKKRGDPDPKSDQLHVERTLWLDFDGGGFTLQDRVHGTVNRSWHLEMGSPIDLGRVSVNGENQLITKSEGGRSGFQLVQSEVQIEADSRINSFKWKLPAVGWNVDLQSLAVRLVLPPGWELFWVTGVDAAPGTWIWKWDLLGIFLLLISAVGLGKLVGRKAGWIAFLGMLLIAPESNMIQILLVAMLPALALLKVVKHPHSIRIIQVYQNITGILLIISTLYFSVNHLRQAIFPTSRKPYTRLESGQETRTTRGKMMQNVTGASKDSIQYEAAFSKVRGDGAEKIHAPLGNRGYVAAESLFTSELNKSAQNLVRNDPNASIQTGPGVPHWNWSSINLTWNGPVTKDQKITLWLQPPWLNLILAFLRVGLLALLIVVVWDVRKFERPIFKDMRGIWRRLLNTKNIAILLFGWTLINVPPAKCDIPDTQLLQQLRTRLTEPPGCVGKCAHVPRLRIDAQRSDLIMHLDVNTGTRVVMPLPGHENQWLATSVVINGIPAPALQRRSGVLWVAVDKGHHQIIIRGPINQTSNVQLNLPLTPGFTTFHGDGWLLNGLHEDGKTDGYLTLTRVGTIQNSESGESKVAQQPNLPPFAMVERHISLGLEWLVTTNVTLVAGNGSATLEIPLLPGEKVVTPGVRVNDQTVTTTLAPSQPSFFWESTLKVSDQLPLMAKVGSNWTETWNLSLSPIWKVSYDGIPVVSQKSDDGSRQLAWRPWPGEQVVISVSRPNPVEGKLVTVDSARLKVTPGQRMSDVELQIRVRSSIGNDITVVLPEKADFQRLRIDQRDSSIKPSGNKLNVTLKPGQQKLGIQWRDASGIGLRYKTPEVRIGMQGVNGILELTIPKDRWILWVQGDGFGPIILFWSNIIVLMIAALMLGRSGLTPISTMQWFLLGLGLIQAGVIMAVIVGGILMAIGWRAKAPIANPRWFNFRQAMLWIACLVACGCIYVALEKGFFGRPEMQISGNGSNHFQLNWFVDRFIDFLPSAHIISLPLLAYKLTMLAWALWLTLSLVRWAKWVWVSMGEGGYWQETESIFKRIVQVIKAGLKKKEASLSNDSNPN